MPPSILYLLKLSISLSVIWLFYQLMLRRLTFYNLNRWYLLGYSLLSFVIPLIDIGSFLEEDTLQGSVIQYIPQIGDSGQGPARELSLFARLGPQKILWGVLLAGAMFLLVRLVIRWLSLRQVRRRGRLVSDAGVKIFQVDQFIRPFSFGNAIYINPQLHTEHEYSAIILHEYVHIRQRHTVDILLSELLCIVNWYNPFVWLIRRSIRQNLEFIADRKVLEKGLDKRGYQYHLLQVVGVPGYSLATNFNFSSLKKRIIMMNKIKSTRVHLLKFLFLAPMLAVLLLAFRQKISSARVGISSIGKMTAADTARLDTPRIVQDSPNSFRIVPDSPDRFHIVPDSPNSFRIVPDSAHASKKAVFTIVPLTQSMLGTDTLRLDSAKPLIIVDGMEMEKSWSLNALSPQDILSVSVFKGKAAVAKYGAKGANGVLLISTKKNGPSAPMTITMVPSTAIGQRKDSASIHINFRSSDSAAARPLYYLDGVELSQEDIRTLNPADIESINVLKGEEVIKKYGEKGRNGVILIQSKKKANSQPRQTLILDDKKSGRIVVRADTITTADVRDPLKYNVYFFNGVKVKDVTEVEPMFARKDILYMENTDRPAALRKYGESAGKTLINVVTRENKDNPNAYILDYQHPEDPRRTP